MRIRNLTPHSIIILNNNDEIIKTIQPEGTPLRLEEVVEPIGSIAGIPLVRKALTGDVNKILPQEEGVYYIVSLPVAQALRRADLLVPDDLVRDEQGRVIGCRRLAVLV